MSDVVFIDGLRVYKPRPAAPDWVIANMVINCNEMAAWLKGATPDESGEIRAIVCLGKTGNYYAKLDTYKPRQRDDRAAEPQAQPARPAAQPAAPATAATATNDDNLPF